MVQLDESDNTPPAESGSQPEDSQKAPMSSKIKLPQQDFAELCPTTQFDEEDRDTGQKTDENADTLNVDKTSEAKTQTSDLEESNDSHDDLESCSGLSQISGLSDLAIEISDSDDDSDTKNAKSQNPRHKQRSAGVDKNAKLSRKRGGRGGEKHKKKPKFDEKATASAPTSVTKSNNMPQKLW